MATAELPLPDAPGTDIVAVVELNPAIVLVDAGKRDDLFDHIKREIEAFEPDVATAKGRAAIKSFAFKITRTKTAIDAAGKQLNEEARARINAVDASRREAREQLDKMAAEVRAPLTDWEEAEKARIADCQSIIDCFKASALVSIDDTAAAVRDRGMAVWNTALDPERFGDMLGKAEEAKARAVETLKAALVRLTREEAERAELERLRAEAAARAEADRLADEAAARARAEKEAAARAAAEAEARAKAEEERRAAAEKAEAERIERAKAEAAAAERARVEQAHAEQLAAERRRTEEAERAAQAERDRIAAQEAARAAEEKRIADEQAKRQADQEHRTAVKSRAKAAIMTCGADEETARKIVVAILAGEIPNVRLEF